MKVEFREFREYLIEIGLSETFIKRVETIHAFYEGLRIDRGEITDIFVTDYIKEDRTREYENLWFFSESYCMEAKLFLTKDDFDLTPLKNNVSYLKVEKQDYDFQNVTDKSRMLLHIGLSTRITGEFKASKNNCDYLKTIMIKHIIPNIIQ